ncbi:DUF4937 domain-containing protein [Acidimangrovimonas pyrenivorans]|uniref:DUF4937 domain-containing protein n=1 Tax=Acidimangrovimonas pyrenivorans TaxID=2030798 RepID=A0ABV7AKF8_9RHOB
MLLKWITLRVPPAHRAGFATAQDGWRALASVPGFRWQVAGWAVDDPDRFGALALWESRPAYDAFMAGPHDGLAAGQVGLYRDVESRLVEVGDAIACPNVERLRLSGWPLLPASVPRPELMLEPRWRVFGKA